MCAKEEKRERGKEEKRKERGKGRKMGIKFCFISLCATFICTVVTFSIKQSKLYSKISKLYPLLFSSKIFCWVNKLTFKG